jgi:hypothetical protein
MRTSLSTRSDIGLMSPAYFSRICMQVFLTARRRNRSIPVSRGVPLKAATTLSVGGWDVPMESGDIAVSRMSTPASTAA